MKQRVIFVRLRTRSFRARRARRNTPRPWSKVDRKSSSNLRQVCTCFESSLVLCRAILSHLFIFIYHIHHVSCNIQSSKMSLLGRDGRKSGGGNCASLQKFSEKEKSEIWLRIVILALGRSATIFRRWAPKSFGLHRMQMSKSWSNFYIPSWSTLRHH